MYAINKEITIKLSSMIYNVLNNVTVLEMVTSKGLWVYQRILITEPSLSLFFFLHHSFTGTYVACHNSPEE